ncbi:hypothetical protein F4560_003127 [Saccharothrix ecbatanensis]|uniref:Uncharacterized protein n=1 Tax=Saccharothrix ecbatanensis TaxID=1105145 RepID=A0A7W9HJB9_9PSEU|nr:hypothetical protein [Saccharothrix ecbatanensis]
MVDDVVRPVLDGEHVFQRPRRGQLRHVRQLMATKDLSAYKKVLADAGVEVESICDWKSLTAALEEVEQAGKKGITFSAVGTEEGSFQVLPDSGARRPSRPTSPPSTRCPRCRCGKTGSTRSMRPTR